MSHEHERPRILLVDDDPDFNASIKPNLEEELRAVVTVAECGDAAIRQVVESHAAKQPFSLIITDMWIPEKQPNAVDKEFGLKLVRVFRDLSDEQPILPPIIVNTGYPSYKDCVRCMEAGACGYYEKAPEDEDHTQVFFDHCRRILYPEKHDPEERIRAELRDWLEEHERELVARFADRYVAVFHNHTDFDCAGDGAFAVIGQRLVVAGDSYLAVIQKILNEDELRWKERHISPLDVPIANR